jgi:hypothetical protein
MELPLAWQFTPSYDGESVELCAGARVPELELYQSQSWKTLAKTLADKIMKNYFIFQ